MEDDKDYFEDDLAIDLPESDDVKEDSDDENPEEESDFEQVRNKLEEESDEYSSTEAPSGMRNKGLTWTNLKNVLPIKKIVPYIPILAVGVILIALIVVLGGSLDFSQYSYIRPRCTQMSVTFGSGENRTSQTISIDEYIVSHIYSATKNLENVNVNLYKTLAIAINTQAQSGNCSESIVPEVDDIYSFEILNEESSIYTDILNVIEEEKNLAMVVESTNTYYSTSLDGFCYNNYFGDDIVFPSDDEFETGDDESDGEMSATPPNATPSDALNSYFTLPQLDYHFPSSWVIDNVEDDRFYKCPCGAPEAAMDLSFCMESSWNSTNEEETSQIYVDGGTGTGISIYGAHYLSSEKGIHYEDILKMFYPDGDWILMSNDPSLNENQNANCVGGGIPFSYTPLSRSEFISLVTEFLNSIKDNPAPYNSYFISYAGEIYDMGISKGINPELIYIFARKEVGFTGENTTDTLHYNYWGLGHTNDAAHGFFYDSFMEGVEAQFDYFSKYDSLESVVKVYSSLGNWLYNFNDQKEMGVGGCYYMREIYGNNYSRCSSSYYCEAYYNSDGKVVGRSPECVNTTETEREAYISWQAEKLFVHRDVIFHLGKEICYGTDLKTEASLDVPSGQLKYSLRSFLESNASSIVALNEMIKNKVMEVGVGTRSSVAAAATTLINYMAQYDLRIPYTFGGGHGGYSFNGYNKAISNYFGVDPDWGTPITGAGKYTHYGPDCSSFVDWAMKNGGIKNQNVWSSTSQSYQNYGVVHAMNGSFIGQVGDIVFSSGHIRLIVGVNIQEQYYITAESQTNSAPYAPEFKGISYQRMNFQDSNYRIVDLTRLYDNASNRYTTNEYIIAFDGSSTK